MPSTDDDSVGYRHDHQVGDGNAELNVEFINSVSIIDYHVVMCTTNCL